MRQLPDQIRSVYVYTKGDRSVGFKGDGAVLTGEGDFMVDLTLIQDDQREDVLKSFADKLIEAYSLIWNEQVYVMFDFQCMDEPEQGVLTQGVKHV